MQALLTPVVSADEAVSRVKSGSTVLVGGWVTGQPDQLVEALARADATDLTIVSMSATTQIVPLLRARKVRKAITTFSAAARGPLSVFEEQFLRGEVELELVPQGTFSERLHAGATGVPAFYIGTGTDTVLAEGREQRTFGGQSYLLEYAIRGDFALLHAHRADRYGNLTYRLASKNFNPVMAMAADASLVEVEGIVEPGELDPDLVATPACCVQCLVLVEQL